MQTGLQKIREDSCKHRFCCTQGAAVNLFSVFFFCNLISFSNLVSYVIDNGLTPVP